VLLKILCLTLLFPFFSLFYYTWIVITSIQSAIKSNSSPKHNSKKKISNSGSIMPEVMQISKEQLGERLRQCLRDVDACIKAQNISNAKNKLAEARGLDPSNPYLGAFEARIIALESAPAPSTQYSSPREQAHITPNSPLPGTRTTFAEKIRQQVEVDTKFQTTADWRRMEATTLNAIDDVSVKGVKSTKDLGSELLKKYHQQIALDRKQLEAETEQLLDVERRRLQEEFNAMVRRQNDQARGIRTQVRKEMEQNFLRLLEQISKQYDRKMELLDIRVPETKPESLALYKKKLRTYYLNGVPTEENAKKLMELKELLELTFDEHLQIESDVREELYAFTLRKQMLLGEITFTSYAKIEELRQQYRITSEQSSRADSFIFSRLKRFDIKGRILLVESDQHHSEMVNNSLSDKNYEILTASSVQGAFEILNNQFIDMIISDVKFPESELDGFRFFSAVQEQFALRRIPFVIMSSINDSMVYRCAAQLGVDDILFKPVDVELLGSIIEGKLKRYRELAQV